MSETPQRDAVLERGLLIGGASVPASSGKLAGVHLTVGRSGVRPRRMGYSMAQRIPFLVTER
jgi:hypothetical protein